MIKRYFNHVQSKPTHHRRQHAMQVAGILTALAFVVWVTTLPMRFGGTGAVADGSQSNSLTDQTQLAGVGSIDTGNGTTLEVVGNTPDDGTSTNPTTNINTGTNNFSNY